MFGFKKRRRRRLRDQPFPEAWRETLTAGVPYYRRLPETDREELHGHIHVLLDEKNFEGCGGMRLDDAVRLAIAAHAGILLLHRETEYYPRLYSILVYPYDFIVEKLVHHEDDPLHVIGEDVLSGEAWAQGAVILSWDGMLKSVKHDRDGYNVAIHEFAHQLDMENGPPDGFPYIRDRALRADWARIMHAEFDRLQRDVDRGRATVLDDYAAEDPAEFFAVATECFFEMPRRLQRRHPELYDVLRRFYCQDPTTLW
ncbi:MAG TPA: zinc-dependent peptidase [Candidatus Hydrogenedentes bacterium]|nr:zinc-dependent peptidase [Candidatus Hydrogenedentota bacterium]HNT89609.1 zinc-dependent peptidase [Candidatus Hydrogenedentota bacterium]